ncbi:copper-binding protein [Maritimibacter sp. 55A14]|uniref:cupredoxin domain-containing protein n=1 Tax=Maritimibacter sp. 55A14 TaxID=2174844 RepID=UPI000D60BD76|nr:cupredoxin family copper-binding protein [Maritimibacter sp. 55A14]PWE34005.1 copper-binding protein [Maritimibacter sp. 55A14]
MRLTLTRRKFGQGAALSVALAVSGRPAPAHARPRTLDVRIQGFAFRPGDLTIEPGDTVVWENADVAPHTATALDGAWNTGEIPGGETARMIFEAPGEYRYVCAFHRHMTGRIRVVPPS